MSQRRFLKVLLATLALVICTGTLQASGAAAALVANPASLSLTCDTLIGAPPVTVGITAAAAADYGSITMVASSTLTGLVVIPGVQSVSSTTTPTNFVFSATAGCKGMTVGTTTGTVTFTSSGASSSGLIVNVSLVVTNSGTALVTPSSVTLTCTKNGGSYTGSTQAVPVTSTATGGTPFYYSNSAGNNDALPSWLTVTPTGAAGAGLSAGTMVTAGVAAETVTVAAGSGCGALSLGSTTYAVHLTSPLASDKILPVVITVGVANTLSASTPTLLTYTTGTSPSSTATSTITSSANTYFQINTATVPLWLSATTNGGAGFTGISNTSNDVITFAVSAGAKTLPVGSYSATVHLTISGALDCTIPVTLQVSNPAPTLTITGGTSPAAISWTWGTALPTMLITPISSDSPIAYNVTTSSGVLSTSLNPQVSVPGGEGLAYSFGSPIQVTFLQSVFGAAAPGTTLTGTVTITPVNTAVLACGAVISGQSCVVTLTVNVLSPGAVISGITPASLPTAAAGTVFNMVISGSGFVPGGTGTQVGIVPAGGSLMVPDTAITIGTVLPSAINLTITVPQAADPNLPFTGNNIVTLAVCNPAVGQTTCSTPTPVNSAGNSGTFQLSIGTSPIIQAVTSASSYAEPVAPALPVVAPYDILSIFGTNFCVSGTTGCVAGGPNAILYGPTDPATLRYLTTLSPDPASAANPRNLSVTFYPHGISAAGSAIGVAPLLFATNGQINLIAPAALSSHIGTVVDIIVSFGYGTGGTLLQSKAYPVTVVATDPGVFTVSGDGQGAAAALEGSTYTLITPTAPAIARSGAGDSDSIMLYVTGLGSPDATGTSSWFTNCITGANYLAAVNGTIPVNSALTTIDGLVMQQSLIPTYPPCLSAPDTDLPTVKIGETATLAGATATLQYAGWVDGAVAGLYQINVQLPTITTANTALGYTVTGTAAAIPVVITSNGVSSQTTGVTLSVIQGLLGTVTGATSGPTGTKTDPVYVYTIANSATVGSLSVSATDASTSPSLGYAIASYSPNSSLPGTLAFDTSTGIISGTPGSDAAGTTAYEVIFTVTDSAVTPNLKGDVVIIFNVT